MKLDQEGRPTHIGIGPEVSEWESQEVRAKVTVTLDPQNPELPNNPIGEMINPIYAGLFSKSKTEAVEESDSEDMEAINMLTSSPGAKVP